MEIIKIDQLSIAAQAGALDADLAYSASFTAHRDLVSQTAASGLKGLQALLNDSNYYGAAISRLQEVTSNIELANVEAAKDPFQAASGSLSSQHQNAAINGLRSQATPYNNTSYNIGNTAQNAYNGTVSTNPERGYAERLMLSVSELGLSTGYLINQADPSASIYHANGAVGVATSVRDDAQTLWNTLNGQTPKPTARLNATQAVIDAAKDVINHAGSVLNFDNTSPIALIRSETPQVHDLGGGYSLATWGDSGYTTLTDSSGAGILIRPDGTTDALNGGGQGWKFNTTSTFVLPNQTKITFTPGSPASILLDRGIQTFNITGVQGGSYPSASSYSELNGREVDLTSNDGYIFQMDGNASTWSSNGNRLGDESGGREVIAQTAITNKLKLDPTDVATSSELAAFLNNIGITPTDYDGDGKLNNVELNELAGQITSYVDQMQAAYEQAMLNVVKANQALEELNQLLDTLRREASNRADNRTSENAATSSTLKSIEQRLVAALRLLQGDADTPAALPGGIEASAERVLGQLTDITQQGGLKNVSPSVVSQGTGQISEPASQNPTPQPATTDALGDSLRRASRLLSGLLGGGNLNILEMPPLAAQPDGVAAAVDSATPAAPLFPGLDQLASALAALPAQLDPSSQVKLEAEDVSAGLQIFLAVLADAGVIDLQTLPAQAGPDDALKTLASLLGESERAAPDVSASPTPSAPVPDAAKLLELLSGLSELGVALKALPSATSASTASLPELTTTAQQLRAILAGVAESGSAGATQSSGSATQATGALAPLSRAAEQLQLVLAGAAAPGSAGAGQSTSTEGSKAPTAAELRLGLQSFLTALSAAGVVAGGSQPAQAGSEANAGGVSFKGNTQTISAISGNFYTDPELMKQLQANLNKAIQVQNDQLSRASTLFGQSQKIVQTFVTLIKEDDLVRDVVKSDSLSDEQQALFDGRMTELRKDWGVEWGGDDSRAPASQSQLVSKAMQSGMMV